MYHHITTILLAASLSFAGCAHRESHSHDESEEHEHHHEGAHSDEIVFSEAQAAAAGLQTETVELAPFAEVIKTSGQIIAAQGDEHVVTATVGGVMAFADASLSEGAAIKAGTTIAVVSAKNMLDGDPVAKAKLEYDAAEKEYKRAQALTADNIVSAKDFENISLRYENAKAAYSATASNVTSAGVRLAAPVGGFIKQLFVKQGEYVAQGQAVAVVAQNRRLMLRANPAERYFHSLKNIVGANFRPAYDTTIYRLSDLHGRLLSFGRSAEGTPYLPVTFEFDNAANLLSGAFADVYLLGKPTDALSAPVTAITEEQGLHFVYLQLDEDCYRKQEVTLGADNGLRVRILNGLKVGDRIVTRGVYQVKLAAVASIVPEGHHHH